MKPKYLKKKKTSGLKWALVGVILVLILAIAFMMGFKDVDEDVRRGRAFQKELDDAKRIEAEISLARQKELEQRLKLQEELLQQQKKREEALNTMVKGCKVRTAGGIFGEIIEVKPESFIIEVAPGVKMEFARASVAEVVEAPAKAE